MDPYGSASTIEAESWIVPASLVVWSSHPLLVFTEEAEEDLWVFYLAMPALPSHVPLTATHAPTPHGGIYHTWASAVAPAVKDNAHYYLLIFTDRQVTPYFQTYLPTGNPCPNHHSRKWIYISVHMGMIILIYIRFNAQTVTNIPVSKFECMHLSNVSPFVKSLVYFHLWSRHL